MGLGQSASRIIWLPLVAHACGGDEQYNTAEVTRISSGLVWTLPYEAIHIKLMLTCCFLFSTLLMVSVIA